MGVLTWKFVDPLLGKFDMLVVWRDNVLYLASNVGEG